MNRADLDKQIANAAARAAVAARNGDDDAWHEWSEWATRLLDQRDQAGHKPACPTASFYARPAS